MCFFQAPVTKRGRGRPKKTDSVAVPAANRPRQDDPGDDDTAIPPVIKGRGRPKKTESAVAGPGTSNASGEGSGAEPPAKKGRGRPKKTDAGSSVDVGQPAASAGKKKGEDTALGGLDKGGSLTSHSQDELLF